MKSKKLTLTLAMFAGSSGADRFYLGQNYAGWAILLTFWVILPAIVYSIIKFNIVANWEPFFLGRFAIPILFHLYAAGRYMVMSDENFKSQDVSNSKTLPLTFIAIALAVFFLVGGNKFLNTAKKVDITEVDASIILSAEQMSEEFRTNEELYRKKYDNEILQIEGSVIEKGSDFEQGDYFALKGLNNDPFGIKCYFEKQNLSDAEKVKIGDKIVIKGFCNGNKLENCKVISVNGGDIQAFQTKF